MPHIFISYAKKDTRELALALADALNAVDGVTAWVDRSLRAGEAWELRIQAEIDRCDAMVVLYSPDINRHKNGEEQSYVLTEIHYAKREAKKQIIPVMAQATTPPMSLMTDHYIDFTLVGLSLNDLVLKVCGELGINVLPLSLPASPMPSPVNSSTVSPDQPLKSASKTKPIPRFRRVQDMLPSPFAWCEIEEGKVTLAEGGYIPKGGKTFNVPHFAIGKYPITNAQFAKFIEAGGYQQQQWWSQFGWDTSDPDPWKEPAYWMETKSNRAECPVVGISWYEAVAFSLWLSEMSGEKISLPTDQQWQRAAQGNDNRNYPWGKRWDGIRCNNSVEPFGSQQITPVQQYEGQLKGDSPFGVSDMAGNVCEWCLTDYFTGTNGFNGTLNRGIVSAQYFSKNSDHYRVNSREGDRAAIRTNDRGFRIVRNY